MGGLGGGSRGVGRGGSDSDRHVIRVRAEEGIVKGATRTRGAYLTRANEARYSPHDPPLLCYCMGLVLYIYKGTFINDALCFILQSYNARFQCCRCC